MKQIKFRAWDKKAKQMVDYPFEITDEGQVWAEEELQPDFIVMQFTGLKDKNGKEIYEGDIVKMEDEEENVYYTCQIVWSEDLAGFWFLEKDNKPMETEWNPFSGGFDFEVIGNIYENPDLLRGGGNK